MPINYSAGISELTYERRKFQTLQKYLKRRFFPMVI